MLHKELDRMNNWQTFFDHHAPLYMENVFTKNTIAEVDFLVEELQLPPGSAILDMGCGTGRHSVELAKLGYKMTGVDLSSGMLEVAHKTAIQAGVQVAWVQSDARLFRSEMCYDAAICLCEGSFGLVGTDEDHEAHDPAVLHSISAALKPGASFILTALNGLRAIREFTQTDVESGKFDPLTLVETYQMEVETPEGKQSVLVQEKKHLPQELKRMCQQAGFEVLHLWGGTAGDWGRRTVKLDEMEVMLVARKER
jgi:2-polyprenyl-3-methyl-5-hydroxy-6-metoxy-1,4-benzoquinol methylase